MKKLFSIVMIFVLFTAATGFAAVPVCQVHFIDAGQSDCILIKGEKNNYLIDTGAVYYTEAILNYLNKNNVKELKSVILTHYHDDHYGGLLKICEKLKVQEVCLPLHKSDIGIIYGKVLENMGIRVRHADCCYSLHDGKINLEAIGPLSYDRKNENNNSLVLQGEIDGIRYIFAGDCEKDEENDMLRMKYIKKCDVLKISHHTLDTSGTSKFLAAAQPEIMVATCNGVDTPDYKNLQNYARYGAVLRSDVNGSIVIKNNSVQGKDINIRLIKK